MKTAGKVLGIVGGALGIFISLLYLLFLLPFASFGSSDFDIEWDDIDPEITYESYNGLNDNYENAAVDVIKPAGDNEMLVPAVYIFLSVLFIASALGLIGALIPNKKVGGIFMIIGSVPNLINGICFLLLLLGGILTLIPERRQAYPYYPYPPQSYHPQPGYYPPQPGYYPPQQYYYPPQQYYNAPPQQDDNTPHQTQQYYNAPPQVNTTDQDKQPEHPTKGEDD